MKDSVWGSHYRCGLIHANIDHELPPHRPDHICWGFVGYPRPAKSSLHTPHTGIDFSVGRLSKVMCSALCVGDLIPLTQTIYAHRHGIQHLIHAVDGTYVCLTVKPIHNGDDRGLVTY